jgi:hypothetical protein
MKVAIRMTERQSLKAWPILVEHSPGMVLPGRIYLISVAAARALQSAAGIRFTLLCRESDPPTEEDVAAGKQI